MQTCARDADGARWNAGCALVAESRTIGWTMGWTMEKTQTIRTTYERHAKCTDESDLGTEGRWWSNYIYIYIYMICVSRPRPPTPPVTHSSSAPSCAWSMLAVRHLTPFYTVKLARLLSTPLAPYEFNAGDLVHSLFSLQVELL